ncbi:rhomboid-like protein [Streptomyces azureus]|uniref:rhomboid-like protein n=1 Tax=Streptomyces azureus TaxID=146537 RepID=UPI000750C4A9|nr:rhomboid-like protein [Streptomyces azureus]
MDRTAPAEGTATPTPTGAPVPDGSGLLDGVPRQRAGGRGPCEAAGPGLPAPISVEKTRSRLRTPRLWRLLPTPTGTPFTFGYAIVLSLTSLISAYADPALVHALLQGSSTDVAHLVRTPELVLVGSALWLAGGVASPFTIGFVLVLTALERRIGGLRTAGVFLLGHVLATLATEVPVGLAVLAGQLPGSSLHRLDYGVSFGVAAGTGALAGLLPPWLRVPLLAGFGGMLLQDLLAFTDPMTNWGHLIALAIGVATWPVVRRWQARGAGSPGPVRS